MKRLLVLLAFTGFAVAQDCPVAVEKVIESVHVTNYRSGFEIQYKNVSPKKIKAVSFNVTFYDAVERAHSSLDSFTSDKKLEPNKSNKQKWLPWWQGYNREDWRNGAEAWATRVLFDDGTIWSDDGTHSCKGLSYIRKKQTGKTT